MSWWPEPDLPEPWFDPVEPPVLEVEVNPVEPVVLLGPDGEVLSRFWPGIGFLAD